MKYLLIALLLVGCATRPKSPKKEPVIKRDTGNRKHDRLLNCVDRYLEQDIKIHEAFEVCKGIYKRS